MDDDVTKLLHMPHASVIPGIKAYHGIITPECKHNRGKEGAIDEALSRLKKEYLACDSDQQMPNTLFHVVLTVDRDI